MGNKQRHVQPSLNVGTKLDLHTQGCQSCFKFPTCSSSFFKVFWWLVWSSNSPTYDRTMKRFWLLYLLPLTLATQMLFFLILLHFQLLQNLQFSSTRPPNSLFTSSSRDLFKGKIWFYWSQAWYLTSWINSVHLWDRMWVQIFWKNNRMDKNKQTAGRTVRHQENVETPATAIASAA